MSSASSPVNPDVVRKVAALARLCVPDSELSVWADQLGRIVSYIDQLKQLPEGPAGEIVSPATLLRSDDPAPGNGRQSLEENARLLHEHGVVPRVVGALDERAAQPGGGPSAFDGSFSSKEFTGGTSG